MANSIIVLVVTTTKSEQFVNMVMVMNSDRRIIYTYIVSVTRITRNGAALMTGRNHEKLVPP